MQESEITKQLLLRTRAGKIFFATKVSHQRAHAYLITGPHGAGKKAFALLHAKRSLCEYGHLGDCTCVSCASFERGVHPDFTHIVAEKKTIGVDVLRKLTSSVATKPTVAPHRVVVIENMETATKEAANAFLKTLEEPLGSAIFILTAAEKILPTLISRCLQLRLAAHSEGWIARELRKCGCAANDAQKIARRSNGLIAKAARLADPKKLAAEEEGEVSLTKVMAGDVLERRRYFEDLLGGDDRRDQLRAIQERVRSLADVHTRSSIRYAKRQHALNIALRLDKKNVATHTLATYITLNLSV